MILLWETLNKVKFCGEPAVQCDARSWQIKACAPFSKPQKCELIFNHHFLARLPPFF
jgi:hypothetical protein